MLPSRLTTEVTENTFSCVRGNCGDAHPTATQAKTELKAISLSEALDPPKGSSYANTQCWSAVTLLDLPPRKNLTIEGDGALQSEEFVDLGEEWEPKLGDSEKNSYEDYGIYHMAGWSLAKVLIFILSPIAHNI